MKEYTPKVAELYDRSLFLVMHRIRKKMVRVAKDLKVSRIVDFCCGTGNQLKYFAKAGFENTIGIDLSENMISVAENSEQKLNCLLEDATKTNLEDNSFDFAMVSFALHEKSLDIAKAIILEARRVTRQGGYFAVVDYCFDEKSFFLGRWGSAYVEKLVGGEHYSNFKNYIAVKGLDSLMRDFKYIKEFSFIFGSVRMRIYQF